MLKRHSGTWRFIWRRRALIRTLTFIITTTTSSGITPSLAMPPHPDLAPRIDRGELAVPQTHLRTPWDSNRPQLARHRPGAAAVDSFRTLALLIQFSDQAAGVDAADFDTLLYETGRTSVRDYYGEISYGTLDLITVDLPSATGWLDAPQTTMFYANGEYGLGSSSYPRNARKLVEDAIAAADAQVDFSQYDNDGNGWLDALMVIHSGPGAEFTGNPDDIWSHKWGITPQNRDGVLISSYAMMPEYWSSPGDITIGVFVHELGHVFGLPDVYDTDYSSRGVGRWSVMAGGSWNGSLGSSPAHPDAWCRVQLGFVTPQTLFSQAIGAPFPQVETDTVIYRLWDGGAQGDEYFLIENRQRTGYDAGLPAAGLLIWHIDDGVSSDNDNEWYPGHTTSGHYLVALEQADGDWDLEQDQNSGDSGDPFPGASNRRSFNSTTTPNSLAYDGSVSFVLVENISDSDSLMTADLTVSLVTAVDEGTTRPRRPDLARNYPNPFNARTRIEFVVGEPGPVHLTVYNALGQAVRHFAEPVVGAGTWSVTWDGRDTRGRELSSGVYWYRVETRTSDARGTMVMLK
jgi:immune inhibitor A